MGKRLATMSRAVLILSLLSGCTLSNPAFLGGELPLIPVHLPDTVAYDSWGFYGAVGSMLTYPRYPSGVRNQAVSAGVYRHTAPASPGLDWRHGRTPADGRPASLYQSGARSKLAAAPGAVVTGGG